jgi:hypothetical protein
MANSKVRFTVSALGFRTQIVSVEERANGDLLIFPYQGEQIGDSPFDLSSHIDLKISVHRSLDSSGCTLKRTHKTGRGLEEVSVVIESYDDKICFPIFARLCPNLINPQRKFKPDKKDKIIDIGYYNPFETTLMFLIAVMEGSVNPAPSIFENKACFSQTFSHFTIAIYPWTMPVRSTQSGTTMNFDHGRSRWNGEPITGLTLRAPSGSLQDVIEMTDLVIPHLRAKMAQFLVANGCTSDDLIAAKNGNPKFSLPSVPPP